MLPTIWPADLPAPTVPSDRHHKHLAPVLLWIPTVNLPTRPLGVDHHHPVLLQPRALQLKNSLVWNPKHSLLYPQLRLNIKWSWICADKLQGRVPLMLGVAAEVAVKMSLNQQLKSRQQPAVTAKRRRVERTMSCLELVYKFVMKGGIKKTKQKLIIIHKKIFFFFRFSYTPCRHLRLRYHLSMSPKWSCMRCLLRNKLLHLPICLIQA